MQSANMVAYGSLQVHKVAEVADILPTTIHLAHSHPFRPNTTILPRPSDLLRRLGFHGWRCLSLKLNCLLMSFAFHNS